MWTLDKPVGGLRLMNIQDRMQRFEAAMIRKAFLAYETQYARLATRRPMRILFSDDRQEWTGAIQNGIAKTPHQAVFGKFTETTFADYDLVVPLSMASLRYLAWQPHLVPNNPIPIPSLSSIELCDDKSLFNCLLVERGLGKYVPAMGGKPAYPYILKRKIDEWGVESHLISCPEQEEALVDRLSHPDYFRQVFIAGRNEYATHILFKSGGVVRALNNRYTFNTDLPIKGKTLEGFQSLCRCPYLDLFSQILRMIEFEGLCCINYKISGGIPMLLEINPRIGGSLSPYFFAFMRSLAKH